MATLTKAESVRNLMSIPGIGKSIAYDLLHIGIKQVSDLKDKDPQELYDASNDYEGTRQDRCLLYVFRCAVYFASTPVKRQTKEKLKWWYWKDKK